MLDVLVYANGVYVYVHMHGTFFALSSSCVTPTRERKAILSMEWQLAHTWRYT